jgi:hypothetical protein
MRYIFKKLIVLICLLTVITAVLCPCAAAESVRQQAMDPTPAETFIAALF